MVLGFLDFTLPREKSSILEGYTVLLDPLSDCSEDTFIENFYRARVAAEGFYTHMWHLVSRVELRTFSEVEVTEIRPLTLEKAREYEDNPNATEFFVTEEPWANKDLSYKWIEKELI